MYLVQVKFAFDLLENLLPPERYRREDEQVRPGEGPSASFLAQGELQHDSPILLHFLQFISRREPPGWSAAARDELSGREWSYGYYWPISLRPHEQRLPGDRSITTHLFAGAGEGKTARMIIRWQEPPGITVELKFRDGTIDKAVLSGGEQVDALVLSNYHRLYPT